VFEIISGSTQALSHPKTRYLNTWPALIINFGGGLKKELSHSDVQFFPSLRLMDSVNLTL
jgi:hypothetical protein